MNGFVGLISVPVKVGVSLVVAATSFLGGVGSMGSMGSVGAVEYAPPTVTQYVVAPRATDAGINDWLEPHRVYVANGVEHKGYLYLFLPGSFGWATGQDLMQEQAAQDGFHGITLRYPNRWTVNDLCGTSMDADCFEKVRMEIVDGKDRTPKVTISRANSIENRVVKLLQYLDRAHPGEGWGEFLDGNEVRWSKIVVAGHSQGAGHAAMIAKVHEVARVAMFGGPTDYNQRLLRVAPWLSAPHVTPIERYYALNHTRDALLVREAAWRAMGLDRFGGAVNVDGASAPYGGSHELVSSVATGNPHGSVAVDGAVPLKAGVPVFRDAWEYMAFGVGAP